MVAARVKIGEFLGKDKKTTDEALEKTYEVLLQF